MIQEEALDTSFQKKATTEKQFLNIVKIDWTTDQGTIWWNECCAMVLEVFGLPGDRFVYKPSVDYMEFQFYSKKDADLCRILLSEKLS